jgi:hypothetical protein
VGNIDNLVGGLEHFLFSPIVGDINGDLMMINPLVMEY